MLVSEISLWGAALVALFVLIAAIALAFIDKKMLRRMLVIFGATIAQMVVVVAVVWLVYQMHAWWTYLLWYLLILFLSICWVLYPLQSLWKKDVTACGYRDSGRQHSGRRQHDPVSANQCIYDSVFGVDGVSDGIDDPDNGELPAQSAQSRGSKAVVA